MVVLSGRMMRDYCFLSSQLEILWDVKSENKLKAGNQLLSWVRNQSVPLVIIMQLWAHSGPFFMPLGFIDRVCPPFLFLFCFISFLFCMNLDCVEA